MNIAVCIFDLDGTLTQTQESIARPCNRALRHFGLPEMPVGNYNFYAGDGIDVAYRRALKDAGDAEGKYYEEGVPLVRKWFAEDPLYHVRPYPHMPEALAELKRMGIRTAVLSNKPHRQATEVVRTVFGEDTFDFIQGWSETVPKKPDPAGVFEILKIFGAEKSECLYFGDTNTDMRTAHNAGLFAVGVAWGFRPKSELEANHADRILDDPSEIPGFVSEMRDGVEEL